VSLGYQQPPKEAPALQRIEYSSGSIFVLVSDGFTDQIGSDGESRRAYGNRRLVELLQACRGNSAQIIAERMNDSLAAWQGSEIRRDDVTAIVFQPL
jgi:serine phosphatase RsbU (regulator of sigma subunit)